MKFRYVSNGDGSYSVLYGNDIVAWCVDKDSAKYIRNVSNSAQQSMHLTGGESADLQTLSTPEVLSPFEHYLPSPTRK